MALYCKMWSSIHLQFSVESQSCSTAAGLQGEHVSWKDEGPAVLTPRLQLEEGPPTYCVSYYGN